MFALIGLYTRCRNWQALPFAGGVLDQPAWLMEALDLIHHEYMDADRRFRKPKGK